jgi:pantetheine-phosphate adenylyltransferase
VAKRTLRTAIYAGSFDPVTMGHLYLIREGAKLFDRFIVAVGENPDKRSAFTVEERLSMLKKVTAKTPNTEFDSFSYQYLVDYAKHKDAQYILRGIRNDEDFEYERRMRNVNGDLAPAITSVFLMPEREVAEISSSFVRGLVGPAGWKQVVKPYLPPAVYKQFVRKFEQAGA